MEGIPSIGNIDSNVQRGETGDGSLNLNPQMPKRHTCARFGEFLKKVAHWIGIPENAVGQLPLWNLHNLRLITNS